MEMAKGDFEDRFFNLLQQNVTDLGKKVDDGFKEVNRKIDSNTRVTNTTKTQVDKLNGKVFGKKPNSFTGLLGDKTLITALAVAVMVFLLILASVLHVRIPTL
jgi:hypothetical protein